MGGRYKKETERTEITKFALRKNPGLQKASEDEFILNDKLTVWCAERDQVWDRYLTKSTKQTIRIEVKVRETGERSSFRPKTLVYLDGGQPTLVILEYNEASLQYVVRTTDLSEMKLKEFTEHWLTPYDENQDAEQTK